MLSILKNFWFLVVITGFIVIALLSFFRYYHRRSPRYSFKFIMVVAAVFAIVTWILLELSLVKDGGWADFFWSAGALFLCISGWFVSIQYASSICVWTKRHFGSKPRRYRPSTELDEIVERTQAFIRGEADRPTIQKEETQMEPSSDEGSRSTEEDEKKKAEFREKEQKLRKRAEEQSAKMLAADKARNDQIEREKRAAAKAEENKIRFGRQPSEMEQDIFNDMLAEVLTGQPEEMAEYVRVFFRNEPGALLQALCPEYVFTISTSKHRQENGDMSYEAQINFRSANTITQKKAEEDLRRREEEWREKHSQPTKDNSAAVKVSPALNIPQAAAAI